MHVNFVDYPTQNFLIPFLRRKVSRAGGLFHVSSYFDTSQYTALKKHDNHKLCDAGKNYLYVLPNGNVYRCSTGCHANQFGSYIGNLSNFKFAKGLFFCALPCVNLCDRQRVTIYENSVAISKPIFSHTGFLKAVSWIGKRRFAGYVWNITQKFRVTLPLEQDGPLRVQAKSTIQ